MKFKANQTVSIKVGKDMITLQKGEEKELPESFELNASLEVVEVKKAPLTKKASKKVSKK